MHTQPTPQQIGDALFVASVLGQKDRENEAATKVMEAFKTARGAEMKRVTNEVLKPHMRAWAANWFKANGLDTSLIPQEPEPQPSALIPVTPKEVSLKEFSFIDDVASLGPRFTVRASTLPTNTPADWRLAIYRIRAAGYSVTINEQEQGDSICALCSKSD